MTATLRAFATDSTGSLKLGSLGRSFIPARGSRGEAIRHLVVAIATRRWAIRGAQISCTDSSVV